MGFKTVIVIPDTQSQEKKDALRLLGAELVEVPAVPYKNPNNYVKYSGRLAERWPRPPMGAIWANQFDNVANRQAHIETTGAGDLGPDRRQGRRLSSPPWARAAPLAASASASKHATRISRSRLPIRMGAALYSYYKTGELKAEGTSITEGIGQGRITANLEGRHRRRGLPNPRQRSHSHRLRSSRA